LLRNHQIRRAHRVARRHKTGNGSWHGHSRPPHHACGPAGQGAALSGNTILRAFARNHTLTLRLPDMLENWNHTLIHNSNYQTSLLALPQTDNGRRDRRLCISVQAAFDHACDDGASIAATELLAVMEVVRLREPPAPFQRGAAIEPLIMAYVRLWRRKNEMQHRRTLEPCEGPTAIEVQPPGAIAIGAR